MTEDREDCHCSDENEYIRSAILIASPHYTQNSGSYASLILRMIQIFLAWSRHSASDPIGEPE